MHASVYTKFCPHYHVLLCLHAFYAKTTCSSSGVFFQLFVQEDHLPLKAIQEITWNWQKKKKNKLALADIGKQTTPNHIKLSHIFNLTRIKLPAKLGQSTYKGINGNTSERKICFITFFISRSHLPALLCFRTWVSSRFKKLLLPPSFPWSECKGCLWQQEPVHHCIAYIHILTESFTCSRNAQILSKI